VPTGRRNQLLRGGVPHPNSCRSTQRRAPGDTREAVHASAPRVSQGPHPTAAITAIVDMRPPASLVTRGA
jgi:hypothetical protein